MENTSQKLVMAASELIRQDDLQNISARGIAAAAGCTTALIYKYFRNLDYLITLGCFPFLDEYNAEISSIDNLTADALTRYRISWDAFIREAFVHPRIYEWIFWGKGKSLYADAVLEYYELFPERLKAKKTALYLATTFSAELVDRDLIWLRRVVDEQTLDLNDLVYISRINSYTIHGMLAEYLQGEFSQEKGTQIASETVARTIDTFVELRNLRKAAAGHGEA